MPLVGWSLMGASLLVVYSTVIGVNPWELLVSIVTGAPRPTPRKLDTGGAVAVAEAASSGGAVSGFPAGDKRGKILAYAAAQIGKPYVWGTTGPSSFDCSGLTMRAYEAAGVKIPRTSGLQSRAGVAVPKGSARPGDICWWPGHVTIYAGGNEMIGAPQPGQNVQRGSLYGTPVFRNLLGDQGAVAGGRPGSTPGGGGGRTW